MSKGYIIMGDIINSGNEESKQLMVSFKAVVEKVKKVQRPFFIAITITLGDEFQAIGKSLDTAAEVIFAFEETLICEAIDIRNAHPYNISLLYDKLYQLYN